MNPFNNPWMDEIMKEWVNELEPEMEKYLEFIESDGVKHFYHEPITNEVYSLEVAMGACC